MIPVGVAVAFAGLLAAVIATRPRPIDYRAGSEMLRDHPPVVITREPPEYRIVYKVESYAGDYTVTTERFSVRRPFDSRHETLTGAPPGQRLLTTQQSTLGRLSLRSENAEPSVLVPPPSLASGDLRMRPALDDRGLAGRVMPQEQRRVAGRACQVYRVSEPIGTGNLDLLEATATEWADVCIDEAGLLLEEVWWNNRQLLTRKLAVEVSEAPAFADGIFRIDMSPTIEVNKGGGNIRRVSSDDTSRTPGEFWFLDDPPDGFHLEGRYAVVPPQSQAFSDPLLADQRVASIADVFVNGSELLVLDRGGSLGGGDVFGPDPLGRPADLGPTLAMGEVIPSFRMSEARVALEGGRYVRVTGTLAPEHLVEIARSLRKVDGPADLAYVDPPVVRPAPVTPTVPPDSHED